MFCPKCGAPNFDNADYCVSCAARLTPYEDHSPQTSESSPAIPVGERVKDKVAEQEKNKKNPWVVVGIVIGVCVLAIAAVIGLLVATGNSTPEPKETNVVVTITDNENKSENATEIETKQISYDNYVDIYGNVLLSAYTELNGGELVELLEHQGYTWDSSRNAYTYPTTRYSVTLQDISGEPLAKSSWEECYISEMGSDRAYYIVLGDDNYRDMQEFIEESDSDGLEFAAWNDFDGRAYGYGTDGSGGDYCIVGGLDGYDNAYFVGNHKFLAKDGELAMMWFVPPNQNKSGDVRAMWDIIQTYATQPEDEIGTDAEGEPIWNFVKGNLGSELGKLAKQK